MFGNKETKEEKQARKEQELMARYGLEDVSPEYADAVKKAVSGLSGSAQDVAKLTLLRAIVEQNFIIIRELDKIAKK